MVMQISPGSAACRHLLSSKAGSGRVGTQVGAHQYAPAVHNSRSIHLTLNNKSMQCKVLHILGELTFKQWISMPRLS